MRTHSDVDKVPTPDAGSFSFLIKCVDLIVASVCVRIAEDIGSRIEKVQPYTEISG